MSKIPPEFPVCDCLFGPVSGRSVPVAQVQNWLNAQEPECRAQLQKREAYLPRMRAGGTAYGARALEESLSRLIHNGWLGDPRNPPLRPGVAGLTAFAFRRRYIHQLRDMDFEFGPGWQGLLVEMFDAVEAAQATGAVAADFHWIQIKEKLGGLRIHSPPPELTELAEALAQRSYKTCDECGEPAEPAEPSPYYCPTRCALHRPRSRMRPGGSS